jgi:hypothetical protein
MFALLYSNFSDSAYEQLGSEDSNQKTKKRTFLDYLLFSTSIQASIGIAEFFPHTTITKLILITQQLVVISTHVFTIYILTL